MAIRRRLPVGAEVATAGGVHFRIWAPRSTRVQVVLEGTAEATLEPEALMDPWEHPFQYDASGQQHNGGRKPDVWTTNPSNGKVVGNWKNR